jgi:hypothetical protein
MTQRSTTARAAKLNRPGIAWIGRFAAGDDIVDFTVSEDDLARDSVWAENILRSYGIGPDDHVLFTATPSDTPWFEQFRVAARHTGAVQSNGEAWNWDARRSEMYIRRLETKMIIGLSAQTIEAMGQITDATERLSSVSSILARPDGLAAVRALGFDAGLIIRLGPAVAVSAADGSGLCVNDDEWAVDVDDGELVVTSLGARMTQSHRQRTGVRGSVASTSAGVRITLE